jgi:hypothetical protein
MASADTVITVQTSSEQSMAPEQAIAPAPEQAIAPPLDQTVVIIQDPLEQAVRKDSRRCMSLLVMMDIAHAAIGTALLVTAFGTRWTLYLYALVSVVLSYNGIVFNLCIRTRCMLDPLLRRGLCGPSCGCHRGPSLARVELAINIGSILPTIMMMVWGLAAVWTDYKTDVPTNPLEIFAWFTAFLYVAKTCGFLFVIFDIDVKYDLEWLGC